MPFDANFRPLIPSLSFVANSEAARYVFVVVVVHDAMDRGRRYDTVVLACEVWRIVHNGALSKVIFGLSAAKQGFATLRRLDMSNGVGVMICTYECESCLQSSRGSRRWMVDVGTLSRRVRRENPDITSPRTERRARQILSHFHQWWLMG